MASTAQIGRTSASSVDGFSATSEVQRCATRHYTVAEIAGLWSLSDDAVRKIFQREPGVLVIEDQNSRSRKRRYRTLRIPEFVLERVHRRLSRV
jgi:hypothetical protein